MQIVYSIIVGSENQIRILPSSMEWDIQAKPVFLPSFWIKKAY